MPARSERLVVNPRAPERDLIARAAAALREGLIVAYPTETFYGLAVDPRNGSAVDRLFALKGRAAGVALPLLAADLAQAQAAGRLGPSALKLAHGFWPGPLAVIVHAEPQIAPAVHAGRNTVAVRVSAHAVARELAKAAGTAITATSANRSHEAPAIDADTLMRALGPDVAIVLDGGPTPGGLPSTIVDTVIEPPSLVRPGAVPWDRVLEFLREGIGDRGSGIGEEPGT
jgi:L-threonylcarbamoyladenylate synthase